GERITLPFPGADFFSALRITLQTHVVYHTVRVKQAGHALRPLFTDWLHSLNLNVREKVVFVGEIPHGPQQASRHGLWPSFLPQLDAPFGAILVANVELGAGSFQVFFYVSENRGGRSVFFSSFTVKKVARDDVAGIAPENSLEVGRLALK